MTGLVLAAAIACSLPAGKLTLVGPVDPEARPIYHLPDGPHWYWCAFEGERIVWLRGQSIELTMHSGRVVRARSVRLRDRDLKGGLELGAGPIDEPAAGFYGKQNRRTGRWGTVVFFAVDSTVAALDSVTAIAVATEPMRRSP